MADTTPIAGIPYTELGDEPNIETVVKPSVEYLDSRIVPRYATTTERDGANPAPTAGQMCFVATHGWMLYTATGSSWVPLPGTEVGTISRDTAQPIPNSADTAIEFDANTYLPFGEHSTVTNPSRFILPFVGRYRLHYSCGFVSVGGTDATFRIFAKKNGANVASSLAQNISDGTPGIHGSCPVSANGTTDYFEVFVLQTTGGSLNTATGNQAACLSATYLGPAYA